MSEPQFRPASVGLTTFALSLATFMQVLDLTIANVSLPTIAGDTGTTVTQATWVITSFTVANAIALPLTGFLSRRFGEVRLFVLATMLFSATSALCGLALSMGMLVGFRALQGAVAGPMYPITQALLLSIYPTEKRPQALALIAMVTVVAPIAGPILGGWITENYSWRWIFFINVPIGIFASFMVWLQMHKRPEVTERPRIDYVGLITLVIGVASLQILLDKGNQLDWFGSSFIVTLAIVAAITLTIFVIWELTDPQPIVDLKLFRHRNFAAGTLALVLAYAAFFALNLIVPLWVQTQLGYTSEWAGFAAAPVGILPVILTPFVGRYGSRFDLRILASLSFLAMGLVSFYRAGFTTQVSFGDIAWAQFWQGLGVALFFMPVLTILLSDLETREIASGSGVATFLRTLAGSFAASLTTYIWDRGAAVQHAVLGEHVNVYSPATRAAVSQLTQATGSTQGAYAVLNQAVSAQGFMVSTIDLFWMLGWLFLGLIGVMWFAKPPFVAKASGAAAGGH